MTEEQKRRIEEYIVIFKNLLTPYLKPTVAIATNVYPFTNGVVLMFELNFDAKTDTTFNSKSHLLSDVVNKYNLDLDGIPIDELLTRHSIIFKGTTILSIKGYDVNQWSEGRAKSVVSDIIKNIKEKIDHEDRRG